MVSSPAAEVTLAAEAVATNKWMNSSREQKCFLLFLFLTEIGIILTVI